MSPQHAMDDIVALVLEDHRRIRRLFAELEEAGDCPARVPALWMELAGALLAHLEAAEEIYCLPLLHDALESSLTVGDFEAHKADVRDAVAEARLHETGSRLWWLAVRAAQDAARRHFHSVESGPLPRFRRQVLERTRQTLASEWKRFMSDLSRDSRENMSSHDYFPDTG